MYGIEFGQIRLDSFKAQDTKILCERDDFKRKTVADF